jgi:hypothetical protein
VPPIVVQPVYDPEHWLESLVRTLQAYAENGVNNAVHDNLGNPAGLQAYNIIMEFPGEVIDDVKNLPLDRTIIHFEIDDPQTRVVGFGDNVFSQNFNEVEGTVSPQEARLHTVNFDVGIWSTDSSGGTTSRMRAFQILNTLFSGAKATEALRIFSDGGDGPIDILSFAGGRFATERVNDINVYRTMGAELEVRVFSRTAIPTAEPAITGVVVDEITIPVEP